MSQPEKTEEVRAAHPLALRTLDTLFVAVVFAYILLIVLGKVSPSARLGWQEFVLIMFVLLFVRGFFNRIAEMSFGKEGFRLQLNQIEQTQQVLKERQVAILENLQTQMADVRRALNGIVTKFELQHLVGLNSPKPYLCRFGNIFFDEIRRLDGLNFIQPKKAQGFNAIRDEHEGRNDDFDLKDYVEITDDGKTYLRARQSAVS